MHNTHTIHNIHNIHNTHITQAVEDVPLVVRRAHNEPQQVRPALLV